MQVLLACCFDVEGCCFGNVELRIRIEDSIFILHTLQMSPVVWSKVFFWNFDIYTLQVIEIKDIFHENVQWIFERCI